MTKKCSANKKALTPEQVIEARNHMQSAANSATASFWRSDERGIANPFHAKIMLSKLNSACKTLGYTMTPSPTKKPTSRDLDDEFYEEVPF